MVRRFQLDRTATPQHDSTHHTYSTYVLQGAAKIGPPLNRKQVAVIVLSVMLTDLLHFFSVGLEVVTSDVKRGQNLEAEAEARATRPRPRPRPKLRGRGRG